jgi:hypothetical protein
MNQSKQAYKMKKESYKHYCHTLFLFLLLSTLCNITAAQTNPVVVIPLGSDVSSKQFNDLVRELNQQRVLAGRVSSDGSNDSNGSFTSSRTEEGTYSVSYNALASFEFTTGNPAITVTSFDTHRIPMVTQVFAFSEDTPDGRNVFSTLNFTVILRAFDNNIADSDFSFTVKFPKAF